MTVSFFVYSPVRFKQSAQLFIIRRLFLGVFGREIIAAFEEALSTDGPALSSAPEFMYPKSKVSVSRIRSIIADDSSSRADFVLSATS